MKTYSEPLLPRLRWGAAVLALALFPMAGCKPKTGPVQLPPPQVQVVAALSTNVSLRTEFIGQLDSPQNVEIRARVEGFVDKILFEEGKPVKKDQPLFELDKKPFVQRLAEAEAALAEAQAALNKYQADVNRLTPLADRKAIPLQDLDNAKASVEVGKASVLSAKARVEAARIDLGYCDVAAPVAGLIGAKQVSVGSLVGKGQPTLLATISTLDPIWWYCALSEVDYINAERRVRETGRRLGEVPLTLILANGSEHSEPGKWVFLDRAVDATTGTIRARAEFANPGDVLRPGMFARARLEVNTGKDSILVPQRAVLELQGENFVWVVGEDKKVARRAVTLGPAVGSEVVVITGLQAGDRVVVEGMQKVHDGGVVEPVPAGSGAPAGGQGGTAQPAEGQPAKH